MKTTQDIRFRFGENWLRFAAHVSDSQLHAAKESLARAVGPELSDHRFVDVGCGSGIFSLAAYQLGAAVHSFDFDPESVSCTTALRDQHAPNPQRNGSWQIERGSILDMAYIGALGQFDVVYSWGVLHHTGALWKACENVATLVAPGGKLIVAIYNDQGFRSRYWSQIKRAYSASRLARVAIIVLHLPLLAARTVSRLAAGRLTLERGMSLWYDYLDWLGGYPFEVAAPDEVTRFFGGLGLRVEQVSAVGGRSGCNEFRFVRP